MSACWCCTLRVRALHGQRVLHTVCVRRMRMRRVCVRMRREVRVCSACVCGVCACGVCVCGACGVCGSPSLDLASRSPVDEKERRARAYAACAACWCCALRVFVMQGAGAARAGAVRAGAVRARAYAVCTHAVPVSILVLAVLVVRVLVQQLALCGRELRAGCVQRALGRCGRWPCALLLHLANRVATLGWVEFEQSNNSIVLFEGDFPRCEVRKSQSNNTIWLFDRREAAK